MLIRPLRPSVPQLGHFQTFSTLFNFFNLKLFEFWRSLPENSVTYGATSLVSGMPYSQCEEAMLKISVIDSARQCRLVVEGKLIAPWAAVLRSACEKASAELGGRELIIELKYLTAISTEGENVILELINEGIKFRSDGVFTKRVVKELTRRAKKV